MLEKILFESRINYRLFFISTTAAVQVPSSAIEGIRAQKTLSVACDRIHFFEKMPSDNCENINLRNIFVAEASHQELLLSSSLTTTAKKIEIITEHDFVGTAVKGT